MSNKSNNEIKTPLSVMLDMAKSEIGEHVMSCMQTNHIPVDLMLLVVKDIMLDLSLAKNEKLSNEFVKLQKAFPSKEKED